MFSLNLYFEVDIIDIVSLLQKGETNHVTHLDNAKDILAFYAFFFS